MNARQLRIKLEPLYRIIAETRPLDEFTLVACFSEITKIRDAAKNEGLDPSTIDKLLAISAIEDMDQDDYLSHYHHIHFHCPYLSIRPKTFTGFKMTEAMANDYLELSLMQIDQVNTADDLVQVISAADKLYLSDHHDLYIAYMDYICESFDFRLPEVIHFFNRENKGSCASSLSMSLSIVHNIMASDDDFMGKHKEFWSKYTKFLSDYSKKLGVKISGKAIDISKATGKQGRLYYGELTDNLVVKESDVESDFNSFYKTGLWANENACNNYDSYNSRESTLTLFLKLIANGRFNPLIEDCAVKHIRLTPSIIKNGGYPYIDNSDVIKGKENLKQFIIKIKEDGGQDVLEVFAAIVQRTGVDKSTMIDLFGSRIVLEQDIGL
jgi:hypothetical protein